MQQDSEGRPTVSAADVFEITDAATDELVKVTKGDVSRVRRCGRAARIVLTDGRTVTTVEDYAEVQRRLLADGETEADVDEVDEERW